MVLVSEGWMLYRRNDRLARREGDAVTAPAPGIYVGDDGKLHAGSEDRNYGARMARCDSEAANLAQLDTELSYRHLIEEANQANTSFYPVDPRGLAAVDAMVTGAPAGNPVPPGKDLGFDTLREQGLANERRAPVLASQASLKIKLETLQTLANATDGMMTVSNDLQGVMRRIVDDLSAYYLVGYSSTNAKADGAYRRIAVRVKRDGVQVRARRGYRAPTKAELESRAPAPDITADSETAAVRDALGALAPVRSDMPFAGEAGRGCAASETQVATATVWVAGEIAAAGARDPAWQPGVAVDLTIVDSTGRPVGSEHVDMSPPRRTFVVAIAPGAGGGERTVKMVARPASMPGMPVNLTFRVSVDASGAPGSACVGSGLLMRRGPFSGPLFVPTVDPRFRRQERAGLQVPVAGSVQAAGGQLLDRTGKVIAVPVNVSERQDGSTRWVTADASLAPLAAGDYVLQVEMKAGTTRQKVLKAIRVVP